MADIEVALAWHEVHVAVGVGVRRQVDSLVGGRKDAYGFDGEDGWSKHIEGAAGEMSVAKMLGRYWNGSVGTFKSGGDVGKLQVKTRSRHDYDLLVRPDARDSDFYVLVTGCIPRFIVRGYMRADEAKQERFLRNYGNRPAAYFIPAAELHPFKEEWVAVDL